MTIAERIKSPGTKKILALDGGGIRGMITVEVLATIEDLLRKKLNKGPEFVLADYFDFVAGTSTGAIIAACISLGMKVDQIREFYVNSGSDMFDKAFLLKRFRYKFEDDKLVKKMQSIFGEETTLGSNKLRTVLMMVMRMPPRIRHGLCPTILLQNTISRNAEKTPTMIATSISRSGNSCVPVRLLLCIFLRKS